MPSVCLNLLRSVLLGDEAAIDALCGPALKENVTIEEVAISEILDRTQGYPYFLQEWGKHCREVSDGTPIKADDAVNATRQALAELDASFVRVRFDRLTPQEKS